MSIIVKTYTTKPSEVHAVRITEENMVEVAKWCHGSLQSENNPKDASHVQKYIRLSSNRTPSKRLGMGYVGDWMVQKGNSFRVFTPSNFDREFMDQSVLPQGDEVPLEDDENSIYAQMVAGRMKPAVKTPVIDMAARTGSTPVVKVITQS